MDAMATECGEWRGQIQIKAAWVARTPQAPAVSHVRKHVLGVDGSSPTSQVGVDPQEIGRSVGFHVSDKDSRG